MTTNDRAGSFEEYFKKSVGRTCFGFQARFARELPSLVNVPTGLGKTAMAVVGWLWRRFGANAEVRSQTPRRLVYCLPMRVLVEQTRDNAGRWLKNLREAGLVACDVTVHVLMGGEDGDDWDIHPEREAIIIGTQDMLLSRALNRGYAASRSRWPMQFGLLHNDCLWVFDEIQCMGSGLATTAQLEAFRRTLPNRNTESAENAHGCRSVWMSATLDEKWLETVDFKEILSGLPEDARLGFDYEKEVKSLGIDQKAKQAIEDRWNAKKPLSKAVNAIDPKSPRLLAEEIVKKHDKAKGRTLVVVNTVRRACDLLAEIRKQWPTATDENLILIHSRFRPPDRKAQIEKMKAESPPEQLTADGMIIVSTQVIEAGVDVSATTLFTELAPWASLVQRFGRCNRRGEQNELACVRWIDLPAKDADAEKVRLPYELDDLRAAAAQLAKLNDVGLGSLAAHREKLSEEAQAVLFPHEHTHVIRRRDVIDLFDTTPDLAGNDIDIDRFVREVEDSDARVFWRAWGRPKGSEPPPADEPVLRREELCPAPIGEFRDFAKKRGGQVWRWNFLDAAWEKANGDRIAPGQVFLIHADAGGYSAETGWSPRSEAPVAPIAPTTRASSETLDATDTDRLSRVGVWQSIAEHTNKVCEELDAIMGAIGLDKDSTDALRTAARWHDWGKAHPVFVGALPDGLPDTKQVWAKASGQWKQYGRRCFRHELASTMAVLQRPHETLKALSDEDLNLAAYLVAAHHGKVRLSIRSLPNELRPRDKDGKPLPSCRFARGVWDGDMLPATDLGGGVTAPTVTFSLEPMEMGLCEQPPFAGQPSWAERMIRLRDTLGPFRLAYLEAILRAADMRASKAAEQRAAGNQCAGTSAHGTEAKHG
ncbi:MAG: CRISPR-associated helicase/endonuclease Cas3 [Planctomycetota bacterium]|nr:MAG: CRISPR-associated helicase/endonuclease Cas3 [Planctomycetota bacterium]